MPAPALSTTELGAPIGAEPKGRGRTQAWVPARAGYRRQTIADLEAGRNVEINVLMRALSALGKAVTIVDARVDLERLPEIFDDDQS